MLGDNVQGPRFTEEDIKHQQMLDDDRKQEEIFRASHDYKMAYKKWRKKWRLDK